MRSRTTQRFRKALADLPEQVQKQAKEAYRRFEQDSHHPGLRFKRARGFESVYSVRISRDYRALGLLADEETIVWFWIGSHEEYEEQLKRL